MGPAVVGYREFRTRPFCVAMQISRQALALPAKNKLCAWKIVTIMIPISVERRLLEGALSNICFILDQESVSRHSESADARQPGPSRWSVRDGERLASFLSTTTPLCSQAFVSLDSHNATYCVLYYLESPLLFIDIHRPHCPPFRTRPRCGG